MLLSRNNIVSLAGGATGLTLAAGLSVIHSPAISIAVLLRNQILAIEDASIVISSSVQSSLESATLSLNFGTLEIAANNIAVIPAGSGQVTALVSTTTALRINSPLTLSVEAFLGAGRNLTQGPTAIGNQITAFWSITMNNAGVAGTLDFLNPFLAARIDQYDAEGPA